MTIPIPDDLVPVMAAHLASQVGAVTPPAAAVADAVGRALREDLEPDGDLSAALLPVGALAVGAIVARSGGVLAGSACAEEAFRQVDPSIRVTWHRSDGGRLHPGDVVAEVRGPLAPVLTAERTALNFLCRLSGIATETSRWVAAAAGHGSGTPARPRPACGSWRRPRCGPEGV